MKHDLDTSHLKHIKPICEEDGSGLHIAEQQYKGSWKRRGGIGAYMMLCRKWDRLESQIESTKNGATQFDIFDHIAKDERAEGLIDDIRDLRRYLVLVEAEMRAQGSVSARSTHRDNKGTTRDDEYPEDHRADGDCHCHGCEGRERLSNVAETSEDVHSSSDRCFECWDFDNKGERVD